MMKYLFLILGGLMLSLSLQEKEVAASVQSPSELKVRLKPADVPPFDKSASVDALYATISPVLGQLVYTTDSYDLVPGLLESFSWDYKTGAYILKLKKNLKFHNGREVTSKDLEFSLLRGFYSKKPSFFISFLNNIEGIENIKEDKKFVSGKVKGIKILDDRTVSVKLIKPNPSFLHSLARPYFSVVPQETFKSGYEMWKDVPIGAGTYKVDFFDEKNKTIRLKKLEAGNSNDKVITIYYGSEERPSDIEIATHGEGTDIVASKRAASLTSIYFNYNNAIAAEVQFRQAIHLAIDRKELSKGVEIYEPANEFLAQHLWGRARPKVKRDIKEAKEILKSLKGLDFSQTYEIPVFNGQVENKKYGLFAKKLEEQLAEIGLKIRLVNSSEKIFAKDNTTTLFRIVSLGADVADPLVLFGLLKGDESPLNPHFPKNNAKFNTLYDQAQVASTFDQRVMSVKSLSEYVHENVWMVPLFERKMMVSIDPKRVQSVGKQDGGLTFFLDRVTLR